MEMKDYQKRIIRLRPLKFNKLMWWLNRLGNIEDISESNTPEFRRGYIKGLLDVYRFCQKEGDQIYQFQPKTQKKEIINPFSLLDMEDKQKLIPKIVV